MFENIQHCAKLQTSQCTVADSLRSGEEVSYFITFVACDEGKACGFMCSVYHGRDGVAHDGFAFGSKTSIMSS